MPYLDFVAHKRPSWHISESAYMAHDNRTEILDVHSLQKVQNYHEISASRPRKLFAPVGCILPEADVACLEQEETYRP